MQLVDISEERIRVGSVFTVTAPYLEGKLIFIGFPVSSVSPGMTRLGKSGELGWAPFAFFQERWMFVLSEPGFPALSFCGAFAVGCPGKCPNPPTRKEASKPFFPFLHGRVRFPKARGLLDYMLRCR